MPKTKLASRAIVPILMFLSFSSARAEDAAPAADTAAASVQKDPLLPEILSPGEKLMWGEHGWMRSLLNLPLNEESREKEMHLRRTMLNLHEIGGFTTLAAMIATAFAGQMIINGHEGYEDVKSPLAWTTVGLYFTTASLSLLSPPPAVRRPGWSTISTHKALAWVHFTGMLITPILGTLIEDEHDVRVFHQTAGYITLAAFAGAMISVTF
jgi:hypothetical protein